MKERFEFAMAEAGAAWDLILPFFLPHCKGRFPDRELLDPIVAQTRTTKRAP
jgi:hypothetical protein